MFDVSSELMRHKVVGSLLLGGIGDAAGWPYEFHHAQKRLPSLSFQNWQKVTGGYWWGTNEQIHAGSYSDDTQLTLSVARSIEDNGIFNPHLFSYEELPLWLQYERGGGRTTKHAVKNLLTKRGSLWESNFFKYEKLDYRNAGANGAAMRIAPLVIINLGKRDKFYRELFQSCIPTHGHPRAIIGALAVAAYLESILTDSCPNIKSIPDFLYYKITEFYKYLVNETYSCSWIEEYNSSNELNFEKEYKSTAEEVISFAKAIHESQNLDEFIKITGADTKELRGSGVSSMLLPIFVHSRERGNLSVECLTSLAYRSGIDTDTSASVLGWFVGADIGVNSIPNDLIYGLQDYSYIIKTANRLWKIMSKKESLGDADLIEPLQEPSPPSTDIKRPFFERLWAWDIGLYEMFWETISQGSYIHHPTLGRGIVIEKSISDVNHQRNGVSYQRARVGIRFDIGQTCIFSTRLFQGKLPESGLSSQVAKYLL